MAIRPINFPMRKLFLKRRRIYVVLAIALSLIGYFLFVAAPVARQTSFANASTACICETSRTTETSVALIASNEHELDSLASVGSLNVHIWSEICGKDIGVLRNWPHFPYYPNKRSFISEFRKSQLLDVENSGERIFGFVLPQRSGMYKFAITSGDTSELWLSRNEDPASSEMIARVYSLEPTRTKEGNYNKYPDHISEEIPLYAGKKYYIESLSKQGSDAAHHVAVYWSYKNSLFEIISSRFLSNYSGAGNHESIPLHAGKQRNTSLESKNSLYYFHRLPLINKKDYIDLFPTCAYSPSFLVRQKLKKYQGVSLMIQSHVYPQDDTDMIKSDYRSGWPKPNQLADSSRVQSVVQRFVHCLRSRNYSLKKIHKVTQKPDPKNGDRFLLNLELSLQNTNQSFRLSEHVYIQNKGNDSLCLPEGIDWNNSATVYFILPVKDQGSWVHYFINQLTDASLLTGDTNFHVIIVDFESKDIDMNKAFNTSLLSSRHTIVSLTGQFFKTLALNKAVEQVPNAHDIVFLFDLHIDVPADIMDSVRMNTIAGRMAYFPVVGRLACDSYPTEHRGFWQLDGYGIMSIYKADWDRFGGMNTKDFQHKWGGEDWDLLDRVLMLPIEVERIRHPGLYHYYHSKKNMWN